MKLVILDRDGTIGEQPTEYGDAAHPWQPLPGALEAIARLNHDGWHVVVASNQSGLGRGVYEMAAVNSMHARMHKLMAVVGARVDALFFCPHAPDEACRCRKPKSGLLDQIGERYGIELLGVPAVGDSVDDLIAAVAAGCEPHLVLTGEAAQFRGHALPPSFPPDTRVHEDLSAFAQYLSERGVAVDAPAIALSQP